MLRTFIISALTLATAAAQDRPNIIFFFVDDLGYGDIGCFWQDQRTNPKKFDTPALDTMAATGWINTEASRSVRFVASGHQRTMPLARSSSVAADCIQNSAFWPALNRPASGSAA